MVIGLAILGVCVAFLFLAVLSLMREVVLWRGEVDAVKLLIKHPPAPSFIGSAAPAPLVAALSEAQPVARGARPLIVAFVTAACGSCQEFVRAAREAIISGRACGDDFVFVVFIDEEELSTKRFRQFRDALPGQLILDDAGRLGRACEVRATPSIFAISSTYDAVAFDMKGSIEWALSHLTQEDAVQAQAPPTPRAAQVVTNVIARTAART